MGAEVMNKRKVISWKRLTFTLVAVLVVLAIGLYALSVVFVKGAFEHRVEKFANTPEELGLSAETVELTSRDGIELEGWWIPQEEMKGIIILLHGMDGMDASILLPQAIFLNDAGYSVFVLDMRAHGRSGGERIGLAFEEPQDVEAVLDWILSDPTLADEPVILLGLSMGGATAIRTAAYRPDVDAVISVSAFSSIDKMVGGGMRMMGFPEVGIKIFEPFMKVGIMTVYGVWPVNESPLADLPKIENRPVFVMHGTLDSQIPVENAYWLQEVAGDNVTFSFIEGADHLIFAEDGMGNSLEDQIYREQILGFLEEVELP
ncbi:alpha/beta fold hydrolase [Chloroflexota bacterium]|nr:alpha/beta fold hydrolase [Chloroflexota bacterium]